MIFVNGKGGKGVLCGGGGGGFAPLSKRYGERWVEDEVDRWS